MELNATIFIQAALILALMAWLSPVLFGPMLKVFDEREKRIVGAADEAKKRLGSADEKTALVEQKTREARDEARRTLASLRDAAQAREKEVVEQARTAAAARIEQARVELSSSTEAARKNLKDESKAIADDIVKKVLGRAA